jgi:GGDEF domain-containing protein
VLNSPKIYLETIGGLGLREADLEDYTHTAVVFPETNIIDFTVTGPDPEMVVLLVNNIGQRAVAYVANLYRIYDMSLLDPATVPVTPISPQPLRDAGVALAAGLALGVGLALVRELLRAPIMNFIQHRKLDELSQALNRVSFQQELKDDLLVTNSALCLCFIHIEGMRDYLPILPQPTLQTIYRHITQVLKNQLRGNDIVGRWDELDFSVLLSDTSGQAALNTMGRVQIALSVPIKIDVTGEDLELRPIIGIAERRIADNLDTLTEHSNQALSAAQKEGGIYLLKADMKV